MSENLSPVKVETAESGEDTENSKSKKKKKAIGAFVVEADTTDATKSLWRRQKPAKEVSPTLFNPEVSSETDTLSGAEKSEAIKQLASARKLELENLATDTAASPGEIEAAVAYLSEVETNGEIEHDTVEEAESHGTVIEFDTVSEGEIPIESEPNDDNLPASTNPVTGNTATGSGGRPPRDPNLNEKEPLEPEEPLRPAGPSSNHVGNFVTVENTVPLGVAIRNERRAQTDGLIVGAVVGYFVGRRRGRIKTEKKLLPVQKKLEKQIKTLQTDLITREYQVRQAVREKIIANPAEKLIKKTAEKPLSGIKRELRPTLNKVSTERIGHVLVAASSGSEKLASIKEYKPPIVELAVAKKKTESMDRTELLAVSQNILVEGTSLRQIYETQLISEKGLRRLVTEHLRGGNVSRALKRELVERQIDFERDPILRDKNSKRSADNAGKTALASMLSQAGLSESSRQEMIQSQKKKELSETQPAPKSGPQTLIDTSLATLIGFLLLIILSILFRG